MDPASKTAQGLTLSSMSSQAYIFYQILVTWLSLLELGKIVRRLERNVAVSGRNPSPTAGVLVQEMDEEQHTNFWAPNLCFECCHMLPLKQR